MKNMLLKYTTYKEFKSQLASLTLERIVYKVTKELSLQNKVEWITLDNILFVVTSLMNKKITDEWIDELANAMKVVSEYEYCEIKERNCGYFMKAICVRIIK